MKGETAIFVSDYNIAIYNYFTQPSSSRKATEMLVKDGKTGFVGFGGLSESMGNAFGYVPKSVGGGGDDELNMDSELRMLMRKMGKKDTITKLKV